MKIYSIQKRFSKRLRGWLAFCGAATLGAGTTLCSGNAYAQSDTAQVVPAAWSQSTGSSNEPSQLNFDGTSYRVVNAASFQASDSETGRVMRANGLADSSLLARGSAVVPVSYDGGCPSCGSSACGGNCGVGVGGGGYTDFASPNYQPRFGAGAPTACGTPCNPYQYAAIEGVYVRRAGDQGFSFSPQFAMNQFGYEWAPRITMGAVPDCFHGYEMSFIGPLRWDLQASRNDAAGGIQTFLTPGLPVAAADLTAFSNAENQSQFYNAEYFSLESSRTLVGWQVAKVLYGFRYIDYQEDYNYFSSNTTAGRAGQLTSNTENKMFGAQIGLDLLYPMSCHGYADFRGRAGAYLNLVDDDVLLINNGNTILSTNDSDSELAGFFELGSGVRYDLGEALSVRAGTEFWYLSGVASAIDQVPALVTPNVGRRVNADDDVFFMGLTVGAEFKY